jgi:hypothetical protein
MPLNFPSNPVLNDTYILGDKKWIFDGKGWKLYSASFELVPQVYNHANGAFDKANSANSLAQAAFDAANNAGSSGEIQVIFGHANGAFDKANAANVLAQSAYDIAVTDVTSISTTAGIYGNNTIIPVIVLEANGRISTITNTTITFPVTSVGGNTGVVTNQNLLDSIKQVDGSGSGLDADLLDGISSDSFLRSDQNDTATGNLNLDGVTRVNEVRFKNSNVQKFSQVYNGGATGSPSGYFSNGEFQEICTFTPSGSSQNCQVIGRIAIQSGGNSQVIYFQAALRSGTLPDLSWTLSYYEEINGGTRYVNPVLWAKETTTASFKIALNGLATVFGTVTVDLDVIHRYNTNFSDFVMNTVSSSEVLSVPVDYTSYDFTRLYTIDNGIKYDVNPYYKSNTIWHAGNDGSGSGLDADLLDGQEGSHYLDWTNTTNKPDPVVTVTLEGDVSGTASATLADLASNTITITTTVSDNSHNHSIANVSGLQSSLDAKYDKTGGVISGDVQISGNLIVIGNTVTHSANDFIVNDPIILLANNNVGNILDIGFVAHYEDGGANTKHTGLVRHVSTNTWYLFESYVPHIQETNVLNIAHPTLATSNLKANLFGNANTATTWQTARTITIGSTGKSVDGSAAVTWTLSEIGAQTAGVYVTTTTNQTISGIKTFANNFIVTSNTVIANLNSDLLDGQQGSYYLDWTNVTNKPDPVVTVTLTGDVTGTANTTLTDLASGTVSIATTIAANSVALGTDTTGNYIATITGTTNQVTVSGSGSETAAVTLSLPQDIHTAATPTFSRLTLSQTTGTAPLNVSSNTVVTNLNADLLDGLQGTSFANSTFTQSGYNHANGSYTQANSAYAHANGAFNRANTDVTSITTTAGVYGNNTIVPVITLEANGRISSITNVAISGIGGGTASLTWIKKTSAYTANVGDRIIADTVGGPFTITLPATPTVGSSVTLADGHNWFANNLTVARNSSTIEGLAEDLILDIEGVQVDLIYDGATWEVYSFSGPSPYPSLSSNTGRFLTTNGNLTLWSTVTETYVNSSYGHANAAFNQANTDVTFISTTAGTYGSDIIIPVFNLVANGRVRSVTNTTIRSSTTSVSGIVQLNDTVTSTSTTVAGTANSVKVAFDKGQAAYNAANSISGITTATPNTLVQRDSLGDIYANNLYANNLVSTSDIRFKNDIQNIDNPIDILNKLNAVSFKWINTDTKSYGLIAQELEKVLPELVSTTNDVKSVMYIPIIAILIEAIKQQQKEIDEIRNGKT